MKLAFGNGTGICDGASHFIISRVAECPVEDERFCIIVVLPCINTEFVAWKGTSAVAVVRRPRFVVRVLAAHHFLYDLCCVFRARPPFAAATHGV